MKNGRWALVTMAAWVALLAVPACAAGPAVMSWTVDGREREALVVPPSKASSAAPVMLVFHGHGGSMQMMARRNFGQFWPEAITVYPQGLPTPSGLDPQGKESGWQNRAGDQDDRDLKFIDAILATLREKFRIDESRLYATGHSNGGGFTYLLGATRGNVLAAIAPSAAGVGGLKAGSYKTPLPVLHVAGERDDVVPFANQQRSMETVRRLNGCDPEGKPWAKNGVLVGTLYSSSGGTPVVTVIHPGTHKYPDEATALIVRFFKEHAKGTKE